MPPLTSTPVYTKRGGALIGMVNYSWPMACLEATANQLTLTTTMFGLMEAGRYTFAPSQVLSIERYSVFPLFGSGIRILHSVADYPEKIVFWSTPEAVLAGIASSGFAGTAPPAAPGSVSVRRGVPFRWVPVLVMVAVWNALLSFDFFFSENPSPEPGPPVFIALLLFFSVSIGTLRSERLQAIFLKPGRSVGEVRPFLTLLAICTGILTCVFSIVTYAGAFKPHH